MTILETQIEEAWPNVEWRDSHVVVAVSGGADSVALLRALWAVKQERGGRGRLVVGHFNHGLRGAEADADQLWVERLCLWIGVEALVGRADLTHVRVSPGDGGEAAARTARYDFLRRTAEDLGARFVAVAHTEDDQAETVLHRMIRGTGLAGLAGMRKFRPLSPSVTLVRPLLDVRREAIVRYLTSIGQDFCSDASNADLRFTRNRLRHVLLPLLQREFNSEVKTALLRLASQAAEAQQLVSDQAGPLMAECVKFNSANQIQISCEALATQTPVVVRELCKAAWAKGGWPLQAMGLGEWQQLADLVLGDPVASGVNLPGGIHAHRKSSWLVLKRVGVS